MRLLSSVILLLTASLFAQENIRTEKIDYRDGELLLQGYLAYDAASSARRPGILIVHEWWGHNEFAQQQARNLAEKGYVAFALDMYGKSVLTNDPRQASEWASAFYQDRRMMQNRARAGLEVLKKSPQVDPDRLAAIGFCFGGTTVLELARSGEQLNGFVSFHGGLNTPRPAKPGEIRGAVLVLHGADDPYLKNEEILKFQEEMRSAGADW